MKSLLAALILSACTATQNPFPTNTEQERQWKKEYTDGKISWSEYQAKLKSEKP